MSGYGDFIVYVDESGDHGLGSIDPEYPVFVLAFCVFDKTSYVERVAGALQRLKFEHFGHDMVVLHEHDIRKAQGEFKFLVDAARRASFMDGLSRLIEESPFTLIASVIRKRDLLERYSNPNNPYYIALKFGLERLYAFLRTRGNADKQAHLVFERRGKKEDDELELEFRRVCGGANFQGDCLPLDLVFADKRANACGLQLADLVARPDRAQDPQAGPAEPRL
jgi:hypothetical protein